MPDITRTDLELFRGETKTWSVAVTLAGAAIDITGRLFFFTCKASASDADVSAIFQRSIGSGITITNGPNGLLTVNVDNSNTDIAAVPYTRTNYWYDLRMVSAGEPQTVAWGTLTITPSITRAVA